jgi:hypothetical protein
MAERFLARRTSDALSLFGILVVSTYGSGRDARSASCTVAVSTNLSWIADFAINQ